MSATPELTVVMIAGAQRARAQRTAEAVAAQGAETAVELIVVDIDSESQPLRVPESIPSRVIEGRADSTWGRLRAKGARAAAAPIVAYVEDHCMPRAGWATALVEAHAEGWVAVGYAFEPANAATWRSRATLIAEYGFWAHPVDGGRASILPGNNISYKRDRLLALEGELDSMLDVDDNLHRRFADQGLASGIAAGARVAHQELAGIGPTSKANYDYGRVLAAARSRDEGWGLPRRMLYAAAAPVGAPVARALRLFRSLRGRPALWVRALAAVPAIAAIWVANAVGQAAGALFGSGGASRRLIDWELTAEREHPAPSDLRG